MALQALSDNGFVSKRAGFDTIETRATRGWWVRASFFQALGACKKGGAMACEYAVVVLKGRFAARTGEILPGFCARTKPDLMPIRTVTLRQISDINRRQSNHFRYFGFSLRFAHVRAS
jgi:hypothetical protein